MIPEQDNLSPVTEEEDKPQWTSVHGKDLLVGVAILWAVEMLLGVINHPTLRHKIIDTLYDKPLVLQLCPGDFFCAVSLYDGLRRII